MFSKLVKAGLSLSLLFSGLSFDVFANTVTPGNPNLALNKNVVTSNHENETFVGSNAVDGDKSTRWSTGQNKAAGEYIEINLDGVKDVKQINIFFERSDADQNILSYKVELYEDNAYQKVYEKNSKAKQEEVIILDRVHHASKVKVTILDANGGTINWKNVGISEIEVYAKDVVEAENDVNHVLNSTITVSAVEDNAASLNGDKVKDGDTSTRWASDYRTNGSANNTLKDGIYVQADFGALKVVKEVQVLFNTRNVAPIPTNITSFDVEFYDEGNQKIHTEHYTVKNNETDVRIVLSQPVTAKAIKVTNFVGVTCTWNNVSISELRAFSNAQTVNKTLDQVVNDVRNGNNVIEGTSFTLPDVPAGFTIESNGADFEQIVGSVANEDGTLPVVQPLTDKTVQISFNITETKTKKTKNTGDIAFTVKGKNTEDRAKNAKPVVIPEIQEWYASTTDKLAIETLTEVTYDDASLKAIVDEFVADYKDFTGKTLTATQGEAKVNAYNFSKAAPDALLGEEGYVMDITVDRVNVKSESITGNMYGMQTILQMYKQNSTEFNVGSMRDYPRFEVRGFVFDIARKPVSMDTLNEVSRTMRYYKMNDFHTHLSDNYIWLEEYGHGANEKKAFDAYEAFRLESDVKNAKGESATAKDLSFSKEEFRSFITSQRALGLNIVPEIDMPAHATAFTKVWPELAVQNTVFPAEFWAPNRPAIDHFDVTKPEAVNKIKEIFDDYTHAKNGQPATFDSQTTVHIGADEFVAGKTAYRNFINTLIPYVKQTNPVRVWGSLTKMDDGRTAITKEASENVQMNLWSKTWANGKKIYEMGFDLIHTFDNPSYMVPNGSRSRAAQYGDLLDVNHVFNDMDVNNLSGDWIPSGDDQMAGAAFALWNDNIDKRASGLTESDLYWRFFDALPFYAEKTWAATGREKGSADQVATIAAQKGTGPNTNPYYQEAKKGDAYEEYDFTNGSLEDASLNNRDLTDLTNAKIENNKLVLGDEASYVTTPIEKLGNGNVLSFDIRLTAEAKAGDILFESDAAYGTHDIRIMADGKLGFTRELYEYTFDYTLPVNETVNVEIYTDQQKTTLVVNGEDMGTATGKFNHNGVTKKSGITNATFALPLQRIGSKTNALACTIDNVVVRDGKVKDLSLDGTKFTVTANNEQLPGSADEGPIRLAFDNNPGTKWHSAWGNGYKDLPATVTIDMKEVYTINKLTYLPRQDGSMNGTITKYSLNYKVNNEDEWKPLVTEGTWAGNKSEKTAKFEAVNARYLQFIALDSTNDANTKFASAAEIKVYEKAVNVRPLKERVEELKLVDTTNKTPESVEAFNTLIGEAEALLKTECTQAQVDEMMERLATAENLLVNKEEAKVKPVQMSATLTDKISMNVYLDIPEAFLAEQDAYVLFTVNDKQTNKVMFNDLKSTMNGLYKASMPLYARQMADEVTMLIHTSKGDQTYTYSIVNYAKKVLEITKNKSEREVVEAMLNYGATAQTYFKYNTANLANASITDRAYQNVTAAQLTNYVGKHTGDVDGIKYGATNLRLLSETAIRHHFLVEDSAKANLEFYVVKGNKEIKVEPTYYDGNKAYVEVTNIYAENLDKAYTVKVVNTATKQTMTVEYSVFSYAQAMLTKENASKEIQDVAKALVVYNQKAKAYKRFDVGPEGTEAA